ncbi:hypothetical protein FQN52_003758 [Onygenales sp. PD_12]|nr:hypothetical protein FQN53_001367 [Emmonsiellopsis sp. PD_33]KAK2792281.1 hypothetical protein FQN52_003758 [Onygenales sp. PD_12]KAK2800600.1 hypothetical protein FQN51_005983 [Onygenales sp. PD_10]
MGFFADRAAVEQEGVYVGGWSTKHVLWPEKVDGKHNSAEDRTTQTTTAQDWDDAEERALVRKLDTRVLFPCCIIYFLAYLDRANLGNVKILQPDTPDSIEHSLGLHGTQFNWAVAITYFPVTMFLIPSNLLMKTYSAKKFFPTVMVLWGIVVMTLAATKNAGGLLAARFFLGIPESGVVPACIMYFSFWYKPVERAWRIGVFHSANALASSVSGFLAVAIDNLNQKGGLQSWKWVFIIEGAMPIVLAIPVYFLLLTFPEDSTALTDRERHIAINRFPVGSTRKTDVTWDWNAFFRVMTRPSTYVFFVSYICLTIVATGQGTFGPTILQKFCGFSSSKSNIYQAIIHFVTIPLYWTLPLHSDWTRERMWHYVILVALAVPCYGVWTYVSTHPDTHTISPITMYGMSYLGHMVSVAQPTALSYRSSTLYGAAEQAVGGAAVIASLSIASIISPQIYPNSDAPFFLPGFTATCAILAICILTYLTLPFWLLHEAKRRKAKTGHAMPIAAMEDAEHSMISAAALERIHEMNAKSEKEVLDEEMGGNVEHAERAPKA